MHIFLNIEHIKVLHRSVCYLENLKGTTKKGLIRFYVKPSTKPEARLDQCMQKVSLRTKRTVSP